MVGSAPHGLVPALTSPTTVGSGPLSSIRGEPESPAHVNASKVSPGPALQNDDDLAAWVRRSGESAYHPVGTCKMGVDPMAVVDPRLRVHGLQCLRVVDASIMPTLVGGNTNQPATMIGEKGAAMILEDAGETVG